jgi:hypothetical protein
MRNALAAATEEGRMKGEIRRVLMKNYFDNFKRASIFFYGKIHNETAADISTHIDTFAVTAISLRR